ncbi:MAG: hypothetical protein K1X35_14425 [Caulobacteraceae bacterium]|nr:hypothetical protein [Caulobacteraceae bacterium]
MLALTLTPMAFWLIAYAAYLVAIIVIVLTIRRPVPIFPPMPPNITY